MVTGNVFLTSIDLNKKLFAILFVRRKGFNRQRPDERVELEEDGRTVKRTSKFREINLFTIL